eukprot:TRINITY_DN10049_c0_g1_i6.p1 TRINITY_DN10049_c0_g1~~TRINITY_DN10049_c0_g1_i6.p1  ORF type:complete len:215 (-),score=59.78 TRINITY_DN10049_c0_g1_i6:627-1271(-)
MGMAYASDVPILDEENEEEDPFYLRSQQEIKRNRFWSPSSSVDGEGSSDTWEKFASYNDKGETLLSVSREQTPSTSFAFDTKDLNVEKPISCIRVVGFEQARRGESKIVVYPIVFFAFGERRDTRRSFSEFIHLEYELKREFPDITFPELPPRRQKNEAEEESILIERREYFERFLRFLEENCSASETLQRFLRSTSEVPFFDRVSKFCQLCLN